MKVDFHEEIKEPIYAFTIKNLQGIEITGTNTMYEKADVKDKKEGESQEITFTQKLDLHPGFFACWRSVRIAVNLLFLSLHCFICRFISGKNIN